jgi:hypothetical protein
MPETLVAMVHANGALVSELHLSGLVVRAENGVFLVPSEHVLALLNAGFIWSSLSQNTTMRDPALPPNVKE